MGAGPIIGGKKHEGTPIIRSELREREIVRGGHYANAKTYQAHEFEECITEIDLRNQQIK
jgi:hypothetical protein